MTSSQVQVSNPYTYQFGECDASTGFCRMGNGWLYDPQAAACPTSASGTAQEDECGPEMAMQMWRSVASEMAFENVLVNNMDPPPCPRGWQCKWVHRTLCADGKSSGAACAIWHETRAGEVEYNGKEVNFLWTTCMGSGTGTYTISFNKGSYDSGGDAIAWANISVVWTVISFSFSFLGIQLGENTVRHFQDYGIRIRCDAHGNCTSWTFAV